MDSLTTIGKLSGQAADMFARHVAEIHTTAGNSSLCLQNECVIETEHQGVLTFETARHRVVRLEVDAHGHASVEVDDEQVYEGWSAYDVADLFEAAAREDLV